MTRSEIENELLHSAYEAKQIELIINGQPVRIKAISWNNKDAHGLAWVWPPSVGSEHERKIGFTFSQLYCVRVELLESSLVFTSATGLVKLSFRYTQISTAL